MRLLTQFFLILLIGASSCGSKKSNLKPLDLLTEGIPLKILAPEDVSVASSDLGIMKDVTIKNETGYSIQIFEYEAKQLDVQKIIDDLKTEVTGSKFFSNIISEHKNGFIFEKKVGDSYTNYDFRYAIIRGDKQYTIQSGLSSKNTLEQVETMFESVQ